MVISQCDTMSIPNILESSRTKLWQWTFHNTSSAYVKRLMDNFAIFNAPLQLLANPPSCFTALYTKNTTSITTRCSLQVRKAQSISIPSSIVPNVWILTSAPSTVTTRITLICLERQQNLSQYRNPSTSCDYHQPAALHHHTFIYHHDMNLKH